MVSARAKQAITHINHHGALLVFPLAGKKDPLSLWQCFYPRTKMRWEWSDDGDDRVPIIWHLREELSRSRRVVYTKWFQGRATLFSLPLFSALVGSVSALGDPLQGLSVEARAIYRALLDDSPLPTKMLRALTGLEGRFNEGAFNRGLRQLWSRLLIVGYGEVEEGGFPSLAVGAAISLFEDCWEESKSLSDAERRMRIERSFRSSPAFLRGYVRMQKSLSALAAPEEHAESSFAR